MVKELILSLLGMEKLLKRNGARRVSEEAKEALRDELERYADALAQRAVRFSAHAKRRTVQAEDIRLAREHTGKELRPGSS